MSKLLRHSPRAHRQTEIAEIELHSCGYTKEYGIVTLRNLTKGKNCFYTLRIPTDFLEKLLSGINSEKGRSK